MRSLRFNGFIKKLEATIFFEGGTQRVFKGGEFDTTAPVYTLTPDAANAGKKIDRVDVNVLETNGGPHFLTISEINFNYTNPDEHVESVELGDNAKSPFVGELSQVKATVKPDSINYNQSKVTSSDPEVASIVTKQAGEELLKSGKYAEKDIAEATVAIRSAIKGLEALPIDESKLINTEENKGIVKVAGFSSQCEPETIENGLASNSLDYNDQSYWHSDYIHSVGKPQHLEYDLGATYDLSGMKFLPRQGSSNGDIFEARVYVAGTAEGLKTASPVGTFKFDNNGSELNNRDELKEMGFGATGRFVKFEVVHSGGGAGDQYASLSEVRFYGTEAQEPSVADKAELQALVDKIHGENLKAEDYTEETWTKFELALGDAEKTLADPQATQAEVDSQRDALQKAYDGLVKTEVPPVEKPSMDALKDLVAKAEALDTTGKTPESVQALKDAIDAAKGVIANEDATEAQIKDAYDALRAAIDGLKDVEDPGQGGNGGNQGGNSGSTGNGGQGNHGGNAGGSNGGSGLPQTGDPAVMAVAGTGIIGSVTATLGALFHRKNRRRD